MLDKIEIAILSVADLKEEELSLFLSRFTRDEIAALLVGRLAPFKERILAGLSGEMQEYVSFQLEGSMRRRIPPIQIKVAEKKAYQELKQAFTEGVFELAEIHKRKTLWGGDLVAEEDDRTRETLTV